MLFRNISHLYKMSCRSNSCFTEFTKTGKKIIGAGVNYHSFLKLKNIPAPEKPIIFLKPTSSYITEGQSIIIPRQFEVNEEVELGVIIGKTCKNVSEKDAMQYVSGYCLALDLTATSELTTAREKGLPWCIGKGFDTACPVSRFIPKEDIPCPDRVELWLKVNDKIRQEGNTSDLIFSVPALISYVSKYMTLEPNDLILTGTPPGMSPIVPGDRVHCGIKDFITMCFDVEGEKC